MEEINEQQRALIADLQAQVAALRSEALPEADVEKQKAKAIAEASVSARPAVLWVDDNPKNNSYIVQTLRACVKSHLNLEQVDGTSVIRPRPGRSLLAFRGGARP